MVFNPGIKKDARELSGNKCCYCHQHIVQRFHHIIPESEGGPSTLENCAPLCAGCHDFAHNGVITREQLRVTRDAWYQWIKINKSQEEIKKDIEITDDLVHKDMKEQINDIYSTVKELKSYMYSTRPNPKKIKSMLATVSTSITTTTSGESLISSFTHCPNCNIEYDDEGKCPKCGTRLW